MRCSITSTPDFDKGKQCHYGRDCLARCLFSTSLQANNPPPSSVESFVTDKERLARRHTEAKFHIDIPMRALHAASTNLTPRVATLSRLLLASHQCDAATHIMPPNSSGDCRHVGMMDCHVFHQPRAWASESKYKKPLLPS